MSVFVWVRYLDVAHPHTHLRVPASHLNIQSLPPHAQNSCTISFADQALTLRSPGGAVEKPREEVVPFSIGAAPGRAAAATAVATDNSDSSPRPPQQQSCEELEGGQGGEDDEDPLGNLPPSRGGVSMAGF